MDPAHCAMPWSISQWSPALKHWPKHPPQVGKDSPLSRGGSPPLDPSFWVLLTQGSPSFILPRSLTLSLGGLHPPSRRKP